MHIIFDAFLCFFAQSIPGEWTSISVNSEIIVSIQPKLKGIFPQLFPEMNQNPYQILSARQQIVEGVNLKLYVYCRKALLSFDIELYVDLKQNVHVVKVQYHKPLRPQISEYQWKRPEQFSSQQLQELIKTIQGQVDIIIGQAGKVQVYRVKRSQGLWTHVIFTDSNSKIFSVVIRRKPISNFEEVISLYQIL